MVVTVAREVPIGIVQQNQGLRRAPSDPGREGLAEGW